MNQAELICTLLIVVAALAILAKKVALPYPVLLVIAGLTLGFVPGLPAVQLEPEMVFLFLLPPLLFPAAAFISWRDFRANLTPISLLAVGLVLFTTAFVAIVAHALTGLPWPAAFVLGAIISPTDAIAATAIANRLRVPQRIVTILEGESLVNDATALVAYCFAIAAMMSGRFSLSEASVRFVLVALGGTGIGLAVGSLPNFSAVSTIRTFKSPFRCSRRLPLTFPRSACISPASWRWSLPGSFSAGVRRKSSPLGRDSTYTCFGR